MASIDTKKITGTGDVDYSLLFNTDRLVQDFDLISFIDLSTKEVLCEDPQTVTAMRECGKEIIILPMENELYSYGRVIQDFAREKEKELGIDLNSYDRPSKIRRALRNAGLLEEFYSFKTSILVKNLQNWFLNQGIDTVII